MPLVVESFTSFFSMIRLSSRAFQVFINEMMIL